MVLKFIVTLSLVLAALPSAAPLTPRETVIRVDSLVRAGAGEKARPYCTGQALRLLPFLIDAEKTITPFLDKAQSSDTILEEKSAGNWSAIRVKSLAVFTFPVLGTDRITTIQAIHLYQDDGVWKVTDFEELESERAPMALRQGDPTGKTKAAPPGGAAPLAKKRAASESLLPVSRFAPVPSRSGSGQAGADRLHLRLSLRGADTLPILPESAGQRVLERAAGYTRIETRRARLPDSLKKSPAAPPLYLASTSDLDLDDPLLQARAASLKNGSPHDLETTRRIYRFVSSSFDYKLGATLFGTSREALRSLKGDCSEAAVLTAALLRATGIPSRVAMGYATLDRGVFIGHAWAEAWLGGEWIGVDAALREFPAGAGRVALKVLSGEQPMQPVATNLMMSTLANLDVEIESAWSANQKLELREQHGSEKEVREFIDKVLKGMGE